jgi:hypothetical protein
MDLIGVGGFIVFVCGLAIGYLVRDRLIKK